MRVVLDLETASTADLRKTGSQAYAEHPDTRVTVACFAIDDDPVQVWLPWFPPPGDFITAVQRGATVVAHNYLFEQAILTHKLEALGWPKVPLGQWSCTMARALVAGYPASLENAGIALGTIHRKDPDGRDLMLRFARPRSIEPLTWWHETDGARYDRLVDYCKKDVEAERDLDHRLPELSDRERQLFEIDNAINLQGLNIDHDLVRDLSQLMSRSQAQLTGMIVRLTNGQVTSLNQVAKLREWIAFQGTDLENLRRDTVRDTLADQPVSPAVHAALQARLDASRSSAAKLAAITQAKSTDGRVRGTFQYYGASRTGRWAGRRLQPQNLFRGSISDVPAALKAIQMGATPEDLTLLFEDSAMGVVASCLRSTIVSAPGHKLVIADFSQIEARVLAWLAKQDSALEVFRQNKDIYTETAKSIGSNSRQLGKVLVLACGFGMGPEMFQKTAQSYGIKLSLDEAKEAVFAWRGVNDNIKMLWWNTHRVMMSVAERGSGTRGRAGRVHFHHIGSAVTALLPSSRRLVYRYPKVEDNHVNYPEFTYMGSLGGNWTRLRAWPGKVVENITQAVARDVMAEAMIALRDLPLVATVHDELIAEVPEDEADRVLDRMLTTMKQPPAWAPDLPVNAAGFVVSRYQKG